MSDWRDIYKDVYLTPEEIEAAIFEGKKKKWFLQRAKENGMICEQCNEFRPVERNGLCATCNAEIRKAERKKAPVAAEPIAKVSGSMKGKLGKYAGKKAKWIKGKKCAVYPDQPATEVHHMMGRVGYADEWARENDVPLMLDERFWLAVSHEAHQKITDDPKWAWENQYSFKRVTDPIFRKE